MRQKTDNLLAPSPEKKEHHDRDNLSDMFVLGSNCSSCGLIMVTVDDLGIT